MLSPRFVISPLVLDPDLSVAAPGTTETVGTERVPVVVELALRSGLPPSEVEAHFRQRFEDIVPGNENRPPYRVMPGYLRCELTAQESVQLVLADASSGPSLIFRIWPDYILEPHIDRSCTTIKADASRRAFAATGENIVWAVLDTGIDSQHPHFAGGTLADASVASLHRDFSGIVRGEIPTAAPPAVAQPTDDDGHGTHVGGIIAGQPPGTHAPVVACHRVATGANNVDSSAWPDWQSRALAPTATLAGMAPLARLVSLKVLDTQTNPESPTTSSSALMAAISYINDVNAFGSALQIHGANLSLGCPWHPEDYAAGQSPLCRALNLLVGTGVVVVVSAGNSGAATSASQGDTGGTDLHGVASSISEPGHAQDVITVGASHRDRPHTFGVWYRSAKGPTLDGRRKPDLVAPGENISSAASGRMYSKIPTATWQPPADAAGRPLACYADDSGTSMAAPHVSGAIAAFLSVRREFVGQPAMVKQLFCDSAVSLGRDPNFEGHGLLDLMAALSNV